jgi:uncharacterized protein YecE (DUF72 family)
MPIYVGTSGYNYPEWKGNFYPEKLPTAKMLGYYAERFSTVEINYTYYRMPNQKTLDGWCRTTPDRFKFTLKAPKRITHDARLKDCEDSTRYFTDIASKMEAKLAALLFQLPPSFKKDLVLLDDFLQCLPPGTRAAFEFRHGSWLCDEVYARLKQSNLALCVADNENFWTPIEVTADFGYFRLRDEGYTPEDIKRWANDIQSKTTTCSEVYVYFKHEEEGKGPEFARMFTQALGCSGDEVMR